MAMEEHFAVLRAVSRMQTSSFKMLNPYYLG
jgi:hypothetical protein